MKHLLPLPFVAAGFVPPAARDALQGERLLSRRYVEGERVQYLMKGQEDGSTYEVRITGTTKKGGDGYFVEEFAWSNLVTNGTPRASLIGRAAGSRAIPKPPELP